MKKLLLLVFAVFCSVAVFAQKRVTTTNQVNHNMEGGSAPENNGFGIKGGMIISNVQGGDDEAYTGLESQKSYHAGLYSEFSLTEKFSIQPEILYNRKGFKSSTIDTRLDYFNIPVLFSVRVLDNISLMAGPEIGVLMTVKESDKEVGKEFYNSFDYGAAAGVEGHLSIFRIGARYNRSFENIYKEGHTIGTGTSTKSVVDLHHNTFQIYVGVGF
jgi:hypothetical protein